MAFFDAAVVKVDKVFYGIAGVTLVGMVLLTLADVILRNFGFPIFGSMELIQFGGCIVFGFSLAYASYEKAMVQVDIVTAKLSPKARRLVDSATRAIAFLFILFVGANFVIYGFDTIKSGEVTSAFRFPMGPFCFALAICFFMLSLTILVDFIRTVRGEEIPQDEKEAK
jgi:TRAP-type C4-dicarboxylate transport system permease small subunit